MLEGGLGMEFQKLIRQRYSVRAYKNTPVEAQKLDRILEAARLAPTAVNRQPFRLFVIKTSGRQEELRRIYNKDWFVNAPVIIGICYLRGKGWARKDGKDFGGIDTAIVMDHLILAATDEGLGTCWIGAFDPEAAREFLELPEDMEPVVFTPVGYPDIEPKEKRRKPLDELVTYLE